MKARILLLAACLLLLVQVALLWRWNGQASGAILSDVSQLLLGIICVRAMVAAFHRSGAAGRYCWKSLGATLAIWVLAQAMAVYVDLTSISGLERLDNLIFFSSGIPLGMLLFLDLNHDGNRFDRLHLLDFLQVLAFWTCVYLYFSGRTSTALTTVLGTRFGWSTSLVFNGVLSGSFALRAVLTNSSIVRKIFGPMAAYLFLAGMADSYASFGPNHTQPGSWFDLVWSLLLGMPLWMAATWKEESSFGTRETRAQQFIVNQLFPLLYPFCSLLLIAQMAERERLLSSCISAVIFAAVGARVLVIQHRLVDAQETLRFEATHDALTGLLNRSEVLKCLEKELGRQRRTGEPMGVIMIDADHFKKINDTHGHVIGDEVLREVGRRLEASMRSYDSVGRYGGEEFLIVVPSCDSQGALATAQRIRQDIAEKTIPTSAGQIPVTVSIGLITTAGCARGLDSTMLLRMADEALYRAKANGRNRVESASFWAEKPGKISKPGLPERLDLPTAINGRNPAVSPLKSI